LEESLGGRNLISRLHAEEGSYAELLESFSPAFKSISRIALDPEFEGRVDPGWYNDWFPPVDAISIDGLLATLSVHYR
jgi:hypothetical protein